MAWAFVQATVSNTNVAFASGGNITTGNRLFVISNGITGVSDTAGNTWTQLGGSGVTTVWETTVTAGGGTAPTITITGGGGNQGIILAEYSGVQGPLDVSTVNTSGVTVTSPASTGANELALGIATDAGDGTHPHGPFTATTGTFRAGSSGGGITQTVSLADLDSGSSGGTTSFTFVKGGSGTGAIFTTVLLVKLAAPAVVRNRVARLANLATMRGSVG